MWVLALFCGWLAVSIVLGLLIGRAVRVADAGGPAAARSPADRVPRPARRRIPMPLAGVGAAAVGVTLETAGYAVRLQGAEHGPLRLLSMDAPLSVLRMYVVGLFLGAAGLAVLGAARSPGRRAWWGMVAAVAGAIAAVKAGGTVHSDVMSSLGGYRHPTAALLVSGLVAALVLAGLWWSSRGERRDRRRVLGAFALYAFATGGLDNVSDLVAQAFGGASQWEITSTYLEEAGEALGGVAFLVAVLVGVAPRVALPVTWTLRREADAETFELPATSPDRRYLGG